MHIFECKVCKYSTTVNSNLHKHFRTKKHVKNITLVYGSNLQCNECNQPFNSVDLLNEHLLQCYVNKEKIDKRDILIDEMNDTINKQKIELDKQQIELDKQTIELDKRTIELDIDKPKIDNHINTYTILIKEKENYINYLENLLSNNNIHYKNHLPEYSTSNDIYQDILDNNIEKEVKLELDFKNTHTINGTTNEYTKLPDTLNINNIEIENNNLSKKKMNKLEKRRQKKRIQEIQNQYIRIMRK